MNGYHALKGFEYQTTVSLNLLLNYFHNKDNRLLIRPEGEDDLVISFGDYCHYVHIFCFGTFGYIVSSSQV
jgi:hypothetical protein